MKVQVSCVGVAVLDLIYGVERLPSTDSKMYARSFIESGGGLAANAAAAVALLGGRAVLYSRVGDDGMGASALSGLSEIGVDIRNVRRIAGSQTPHSVVLIDPKGDRALIHFGSDLLDPDADWLPVQTILEAQVVLADIAWTNGAIRALTAARNAGLPAVIDADTSSSASAVDAVAAASHAVFSRPGLADLFDTDDPEEGLRRAASRTPFVAVTLGAEGVLWLDRGGRLQSCPAVPVAAVETVGAGDVFHGAFALALAEGRDDRQAIQFAAAAAAIKCGRSGGRPSFPSRREVDQLLSQRDCRRLAPQPS